MFAYQDGEMWCEETPLAEIARSVGTPTYVYSRARILERAGAYAGLEGALACYAVKANSNPAILRLIGELGLGADVTSGGELFLARHAGIPAQRIIFSGVGKTEAEIRAALQEGIRALHVESEMELRVVADTAAAMQQVARIGVRVNPDIEAETHPYHSTGQHEHKFGVPWDVAERMLRFAAANPALEPVGLAAHIGSNITDLAPFRLSAAFLVQQAELLKAGGIELQYLDVGGGLGIGYEHPEAPAIADWVEAVATPVLAAGYEVVMEPGRSIVGPSGTLLTRVTYTKAQGDHQFVIVDAGMSDLLRPTLYQAYHPVLPVTASNAAPLPVDIVGPICETGDWLARERPLVPVEPGDLLTFMQAGAYGFVMSSNYNGRLRPAEVLVDGGAYHVIRQRQSLEHLLDGCPKLT